MTSGPNLADIVESCDAIQSATQDLDLQSYQENRLVRSSVEREFILIGEAMAALARIAPAVFGAITRARRIVDFRNQLTHEYPTVDDALVWAIIETDAPFFDASLQSLSTGIHPRMRKAKNPEKC